MDNGMSILHKNRTLILLLRNKEIRIKEKIDIEQKKHKLLKQRNILLKQNIESLQYEQKKCKILKDTISKEKEKFNDYFFHIFPFFFLKIPFVKLFGILLLIVSSIANFYKERPEQLDKKISGIASGIESNKLEFLKNEKEIENISETIKKLQKQLKQNKFDQNICYWSTMYIFPTYINSNQDKKLVKNN